MAIKSVFPGRVIFDHLPKTAGQSINIWLSESLGSGCVTPNLIGSHIDLIRQYGGLYSVISAHVHFHNAEGLDPRYQYMTFFRDPVDRLVSWLYFLINNHDETQIHELRRSAKLFLSSNGEEVSEEFIGSISNVYVEHFCCILGNGQETDDEKITNSFSAIQDYDVVGVYNEMPRFLADVANLIGICQPQEMPRINVTTQRPQLGNISPILRKNIEALNHLDLRLYDKILAWKAKTIQGESTKSLSPPKSNWKKYNPVRERVVNMPELTIIATSLREGYDIPCGQLMTFDVDFFLTREVFDLEMGIHIFDSDRQWAFGINSTLLGQSHLSQKSGSYRASYHLIADLPAGKYTAGFAFAEKLPKGGQHELAWHDVLCEFQVYHQVDKSFAGYAYLPAEIGLSRTPDITKHHFSGDDPRLNTSIGSRLNGCMLSTAQEGYLIFGPYIPLIAGHYQACIYFETSKIAGARADVATNGGNCVLAEGSFSEPDEGHGVLKLSFVLTTICNDLEVRVWCTNYSDLKISAIDIDKTPIL